MTPAVKGVFRGDADGMVDALIAACQKKVTVPEVLDPAAVPLRELVPYYGTVEANWDESNNPNRKAASKGNKRKGSPPNQRASSPPSGVSRPTSAPVGTPNMNKKHETAAGRHAAQQPASPVSSMQDDTKARTKARTPATGNTKKDDNNNRRGSPVAASNFACPAFFSSPAASLLPPPPSSLLLRARLCQAAA